jgi:TetR/AcrR family transcriptional regulator, regulator of cefoperazone and chloramphenicol sensitivity
MTRRVDFSLPIGKPQSGAIHPSTAATREKLLEAAGQVFAERGYHHATIREICRLAGANVAAVNYTFGDKLGLYTEVLRQYLRAPQMAQLIGALDAATSPEEVARQLIRVRLQGLCSGKRPDWGFRIVMHEFSQPTPAMTRVIDEAVRPIYKRSLSAVGQILGLPPDDETTRLCNNSIIGQVLFYAFSQPVLSRLQPDLKLTPQQVERIADHISEFSLAALAEMSRHKRKRLKLKQNGKFPAPDRKNGHESSTRRNKHRHASVNPIETGSREHNSHD